MTSRYKKGIDKKALFLTIVLHVLLLTGLFLMDTDMTWLENLLPISGGDAASIDIKA